MSRQSSKRDNKAKERTPTDRSSRSSKEQGSEKDHISQLTINDPSVVQLVNLLQDCNLFDDYEREHDLEITLLDLQNLLRVGGSVSMIEKCMHRMYDEDKYFPNFEPFLNEVQNTKQKIEEEEAAKATMDQIKKVDACFPDVIELLTNGSFFRDCELGSIDVSVDDLSRLVKIARGGKPLLKILEKLNRENAQVNSVAELKSLVKSRRKSRSSRKEAGPPPQVMAAPARSSGGEDSKHQPTPKFFTQPVQQREASSSSQRVIESEMEGEEGDVSVPRFTRVSVEAGGSFMETLTIAPGPPSEFGTHVSWHFKECYGYDINFSVTCNGIPVRAPTRCSSDKGSYDTPPNQACEISFVWDNSFSWINAKEIEWFFFIFSAKEAEEQRAEQANSKAARETIKKFNHAFNQLSLEIKQIQTDWAERKAKADQVLAEAQRVHAQEMKALANEATLADHQMHQKRLPELYSVLDSLEKMGSTRCKPLRDQVSLLVSKFRES